MTADRVPTVAVAVATRDRPLRLRWLLNALAEQTIDGNEFEVLVAHDSRLIEIERLLATHPLASRGQLRALRFPAGTMLAGAKRNAAWQSTNAPLVLFTDDDCRPAPDWVAQALAAARASPEAVLQGVTAPDPDERATLLGAPWVHTVSVDPPTVWGETCNIGYPRGLLEALGGFDEGRRVAEDSDLAIRARVRGAPVIAVPQMRVYHAVEERPLSHAVRSAARWADMAWLAKRHPEVRREMWGRIWWAPEHAALAAALAGVALAPRRRAASALVIPWLALSLRHRGYGPRGIARSISELPGRAAIDAAGLLALARGSLRYRTLLL